MTNIKQSDFSIKEISYQNTLKEAQEEAVIEMLEDNTVIEEVQNVVENTAWFASAMRDKIVDPKSPKIACKNKCHWCCYQSVSIFAPEVFRITKYIKANFVEEKKKSLIQKLENLFKKSQGKTPAQRGKLKIPCAFLSQKRCLIYEARPLACQRQTSFKVKDCKKALPKGFPFGSIISEKAQLVAYNGAMQGMIAGLTKVLPDHELFELDLTAAVLIMLKDESISKRWLSGELCFQGCKINT